MPTEDMLYRLAVSDPGVASAFLGLSKAAAGAAASTRDLTAAQLKATDAENLAASAATRASDLRIKASLAQDAANQKVVEGDTEGAAAAKEAADALKLQASAAAATSRELNAAAVASARSAKVMADSRAENALSATSIHGLIGEASGLTGALEKIPTPVTVVAGALGKVAVGAGLAAAAIAAFSIDQAAKFQQGTNVFVTAAGETTAGLATVRAGLLNIARLTGTSLTQLEAGMYVLEKAGDHGAAGLKVLTAAAEGAREENASLSDVTNALTSIMASYHFGVDKSVQVMNALKTGAGQAKVTMEDFAGALSTVIPIASSNGIALGQVLGAMGTLTQHGTSAAEATQELASTIRSLAAPNNVAIQQMQQFGLKVNDVTKNIGQRGLTGTINLLVGAITSHMGPAGLVMQKAFNQSATASQDANIMIKAMPASVAALARQFQAGTISYKDYYTALKALPPEQRNLGQQFMATENNAKGFNQLLKSGSPAAQTFTSALRKVAGGAIGLNTILQLSGANMSGFKDRTAAVTKSLNDSSPSVEGWASTQKTFNVELDRAKEGLDVMAIELGTKLLPVATRVMTWIATKGVDDLQRFGDWFERNKGTIGEFGGFLVSTFGFMSGSVLEFAKVAIDGMADAMGWVPGIGGKLKAARASFDSFYSSEQNDIKAFANKMYGLGNSAGADLAAGFAGGIGSNAFKAANAAHALGANTAQILRNAIVAKSPSKLTFKTGQDFTDGFGLGIKSKAPTVTLTAAAVARQIFLGLQNGFRGESSSIKDVLATPVQDALVRLTKTLDTELSKQQAKLKTAESAYRSLASAQKSAISSMKQNIAGSVDISSLFGTDANGNPTTGNLGSLLSSSVGPLQTEATDLKKLRGMHLSQGLLAQISALSPSQAVSVMSQILSGQAGSISSLNKNEGLIQSFAGSSASTVVKSPTEQRQLANAKIQIEWARIGVLAQEETNRRLELLAAKLVAGHTTIVINGKSFNEKDPKDVRALIAELKKLGYTASIK